MMDSLKRKRGAVEEGERGGKRPSQPQVAVYKFEILMPHGLTVTVRISHGHHKMMLPEFINKVKQAYDDLPVPASKKREVDWLSPKLHFVDAFEEPVGPDLNFKKFPPNVSHILRLKDGSAEAESADKFENMWDLTPHTDLLQELPEEYTFETALADLIDNSLQAVWSNEAGQKKLISLSIEENSIEIFDTGSGMDGSPESSIAKWGKLGASLHRLVREKGIGTKPPYLMPCFGMFGYGGPMAAMHLGSRASVASKTKQSKKVFFLHLEKEAIIRSNSEQAWRANGGVRDPKRAEKEASPHGSFTKVRIHEAKLKSSIEQIRCRLNDIYFPYIQCDELSATGQTVNPIDFEVNGMNLAEVYGGEVAVTNMHSCNGPEFTLQVKFTSSETSNNPDKRSREANARLRCVYFPIIQGKESIESMLEKLTESGCGVGESFKNFSRVSIRRLGRLLPEARWAWLPYMEPKQKRSAIGQTLRRLCYRVKCFIDTDGGFNPTTSKTDLAPQNIFTIALKTFGKKQANKETDLNVKITKDGRKLSLSELEKLYEEWLKCMHNRYDQEMVSGCDEATYVLGPPNKEGFGISSDVIRVHKSFWRKGALWESGQNVKILKGACAGFHKTHTYATLEYIILEGVEEDAGCEARLICRPIGVPAENGCFLTQHETGISIRLGSSFSIPVSAIDSQKFIAVDNVMWQKQIQRRSLKAPSVISGGKSLLEKAFQTERRELRPAFEIPITITAGKHLENLAFEVVKANGEVDEGIHCQGNDGGYHTLSISSDSFEVGSSRRYNFSYGRCIIQEIPLPNKEGQLCFKVAHSQHPELNLTVEVHILEDFLQDFVDEGYNHSDSALPSAEKHMPEPNQEDFEDEGFSDDSDSADVNLEKCAPNVDKTPSRKGKQLAAESEKSVNDLQIDICIETPIPCAVLQPEPGINGQPESQTDYDPIDNVEADHMESWDHLTMEELKDEILKTGVQVKEVETKIHSLVTEQYMHKENISKLQAEYVLLSENNHFSFASEQNLVKKHISRKTDSAAAAICQFSQPSLSEGIQWEFAENVLGVVACIGSVQDDHLSRILAHYLGENQMLGIVCQCEEESLLESDTSIQALAAKLGMPLPKNYHLYCMDKIRPYSGSVSNDSRRELQLPNPRLPSGEIPPGFLGHAVNLIDLNVNLRPRRTASGCHGLRETLLYRLFGTLQVYQSKEHLKHARSCIKKDAVSLDGAILRGNGVVSFALGDVDVQFPVCPGGNPTPEEAELGGRTEAEMEALREVGVSLGKEQAEREKILQKFRKQESRYLALIGIKEEAGEPLALMPPPPLPEASSSQIKEEQR